MAVLVVKLRWIRIAAVFSIAAIVLNFLTLQYLESDRLEAVDMTKLQGKTIIIDPGHGGIDDGASGNGIVEKELNLTISLKLRDTLQGHGAQVIMIRENDMDFYTKGKGGKRNDLLKRVEIINTSGADLFVSIHADSIRAAVRPGAQVLYGPGIEESKKLAEVLQLALKDFPPGNKRQAKEDKAIRVLNDSTIPGVLVETGFLSEKKEAANLGDPLYQQRLAEGLAKGLAYHFTYNVGI